VTSINTADSVEEVKRVALDILKNSPEQASINQERIENVWNTLDQDYFLYFHPNHIAWHIQSLIF